MRDAIPPNAKMVFKGKIFEVWQWEQKMFDGSTSVFERLRRPNTAQVVAVVGDKILLQTQQQPDKMIPFPSLPGGRFEGFDEDPLEAAKREFLEETGYVSNDWILWKKENPVGKIEWTVYTFIARNCRKQQEPQLDAGEKITTRLIDFEEFLMLSENPSFYERELFVSLFKARFSPEAKAELKKLLFGE
ncbi:MAG: NUDIX domain-containing protein [Candidatus Pacebacteria bacterium]|nr:NUDIX domain-containing protein [Candidatus Paceibacterota bacterium]